MDGKAPVFSAPLVNVGNQVEGNCAPVDRDAIGGSGSSLRYVMGPACAAGSSTSRREASSTLSCQCLIS